ncbi:MAG: aminotransferase class V-fold PLP-dependent enzyme [Sneathiella sp.]
MDLRKFRKDTPGTKGKIHLNNAGASLLTTTVHQAVIEHMELEMSIGGYEAQNRAKPALERTYDAIAELINCSRDEIALMENATAAWLMAFHSIAFNKGDRILTSEAEYASNAISYLQVAKKNGVKVDVVPSDEHGQLDITALETMIDPSVALISISHIPSNGGLINPAAEVGKIAKQHNIPYLLDACQSIGQIPLDMEEIGCDMLSATGRKYLRAPRGTGFLYIRKGFMDTVSPPFLDLLSADWTDINHYKIRDDARRYENWESNIAAQIGLGVAIDYYLNAGVEATSTAICTLAAEARKDLSAIPGITVHDIGLKKGGIVTFSHYHLPAQRIKEYLATKNINVSTTGVGSTRYDMEKRNLETIVRASFHYYNTRAELDIFLKETVKLVLDLQKIESIS